MVIGVYAIEDLGNGRVYIGSSTNVDRRCRAHFLMLKRGDHFCRHLQNSYNLRGKDSISFRLVEETSFEDRLAAEARIIASYSREILYNQCMTPCEGVLGLRWTLSEEAKEKHRQLSLGHATSPETREKIRQANIRRRSWEVFPDRTGRPHTKEAKTKISAASSGKRFSEEHRSKIGAAQRAAWKKNPDRLAGRVISPEARAKISEKKREWWRKRREGVA